MENFAKSKNLDPLLAETWANISSEDISIAKVSARGEKQEKPRAGG